MNKYFHKGYAYPWLGTTAVGHWQIVVLLIIDI